MAELARFQKFIVDEKGNVVPGAQIEVRREADDVLASLFTDRAGVSSTGNPVSADGDGQASFYVIDGVYKITVTLNGQTRTYRHQVLEANAPFGVVLKTVDQTKTGTTSLAADSELVFRLEANTKYHVRGVIFFDTTASGDFKWRHSGPASPTLVRVHRRTVAPAATADTNIAVDTAYSGSDVAVTSASTNGGFVHFDAILHNGANAGNFEFQWAQNTSDVGNTIVRAGSYLEWKRV